MGWNISGSTTRAQKQMMGNTDSVFNYVAMHDYWLVLQNSWTTIFRYLLIAEDCLKKLKPV